MDGDFFSYTRHEPVGVCGQIIPVSVSPSKGHQEGGVWLSQADWTLGK